jgi:two-component system chemotaxis response regulator CheY
MRALIIDDSRTMRRLLNACVANATGAEIQQAENGAEALASLAAHMPVDVVLVDWDMPGMTGIAFVRAVRPQPRYDGVKLMMVTAHVDAGALSEALDEGADDFLMKPLDEDMVADKLRILRFAD